MSADWVVVVLDIHFTVSLTKQWLMLISIAPGKVIITCFFNKLPNSYSINTSLKLRAKLSNLSQLSGSLSMMSQIKNVKHNQLRNSWLMIISKKYSNTDATNSFRDQLCHSVKKWWINLRKNLRYGMMSKYLEPKNWPLLMVNVQCFNLTWHF